MVGVLDELLRADPNRRLNRFGHASPLDTLRNASGPRGEGTRVLTGGKPMPAPPVATRQARNGRGRQVGANNLELQDAYAVFVWLLLWLPFRGHEKRLARAAANVGTAAWNAGGKGSSLPTTLLERAQREGYLDVAYRLRAGLQPNSER